MHKPSKRFVPPSLEKIHGHETIQEALWNAEGDVERASITLQCTAQTIYNYLRRNPESAELRKEAKEYFIKQKVEQREKLLYALQEQKKNAPVSFAAIKYYLDTHGQEEGWGKITEQANEEQAKVALGNWGAYLEQVRSKTNPPPQDPS